MTTNHEMMDYEKLYYPKQHFITIRQTTSRKLYLGNQQLHKLLRDQDPTWDIFITKYGIDQIVTTLILDFDSEEDPKIAYKDAKKLQRWTKHNDLNTVIVKSGRKGYHTYTQLAPWGFINSNPEFNKIHFQRFVDNIIGKPELTYTTLDLTNTGAGLKSNIRLIGSLHPKSGERCKIIDGRFKDWDTEINDIKRFESDCYWDSYHYASLKVDQVQQKKKEILTKVKSKYGPDPCEVNDLRELMPRIYGGTVKTFGDYITMQCPWHDDKNPSLKVKKELYYCYGCHETGNWWTLRKKGVVDFEDDTIKINSK